MIVIIIGPTKHVNTVGIPDLLISIRLKEFFDPCVFHAFLRKEAIPIKAT
jgi:hypothetical protein